MASQPPITKPSADNKIGEGVTGASGGTALALFAQSLPPHHPWKPFLASVAPSASILLSAVAIWIGTRVKEYFGLREAEVAILKMEVTLRKAMADPMTSDTRRQELQQEWDELQATKVNLYKKRVRLLTTRD